MHQNDFSIVLPSNSSMKYFESNTTTNYSTRLPKEVELYGRWHVGLSEIQIPGSILHLQRDDTKITELKNRFRTFHFQHGTYSSITDLVQAINEALSSNKEASFMKLSYDDKGGYVTITINNNEFDHKSIVFSGLVKRILGFEDGFSIYRSSKDATINIPAHPASLARSIPDQLFIYSNICEPCIVGDTHASLLRIVTIDAKNFNFGSTIVKRFSPPSYIPVLTNRFQIVDIDIRDQFGKPIPFQFGTLTVTLHFKKDY